MATTLPEFPPFDVGLEPSSLGLQWKKWTARLENLFIALAIEDKKRQKALLLHYGGSQLCDIYYTLESEEDEEYQHLKAKLNSYFEPKINITFETYNLRQLAQAEDESIDKFVTRLREAASRSQFNDTAREIKDQIATAMEGEPGVLKVGRKDAVVKSDNKDQLKPKDNDKVCFSCGGSWPHPKGRRSCPSYGLDCRRCGTKKHFARMCKNKKNVRIIAGSDDSETDDDSYRVSSVKSGKKCRRHVTVKVDSHPVRFQVDSGADVNIMDEKTFSHIKERVKLSRCTTRLYAYGSRNPLPLLGKFTATLSNSERYDVADIYVVHGTQNAGSLLGSGSATALGILKIVNQVNVNGNQNGGRASATEKGARVSTPQGQTGSVNSVDQLVAEYDDLFQGIGKLKGVQVKLHIDEQVQLVAQKHRRVPFHLREKLDAELERLEKAEIIEKVETATNWVSPIVITPKNGTDEIRMCVDKGAPNRAIKRVRHVIPTIEDLRHDVNGAKVFSKLDLANGFHQLELHEDSRGVTTFSTHVGLRRFRRLNFGTNSAPEIFHEELRKLLTGIKGVRNIHDDILVTGVDIQDHYRALSETFQRLREAGLTLKRSKCEFERSELTFFGLVFTKDGIRPDPEKVKAIQHLSPPKNVAQLRSFLGMTNYSAQFIPDYATLVDPLRSLTKKDVHWVWTEGDQECFDKLKESLKENALLNYYDPSLPTEVVCDASPVGVSAILAQYKSGETVPRVIAYNSRTLTPVERMYGQIERESLSIQFGCLKNQLYLLGHEFTVVTDHQPLVCLYNNPRRPGPFRVERMRLKLQGFSFKVVYRPGKFNPSDYTSRQPLSMVHSTKADLAASKELESHVHWVVEGDVPLPLSLNDIQRETMKDRALSKVYEHLQQGTVFRKEDKDLQPYQSVAGELSIAHGVIIRGRRIVLPTSLHKKVINTAHEGHQGLIKTKQLLRSRVWFPRLEKKVESCINTCIRCQATVHTASQEPVKSTTLPNGPWECLSMDFYGPMPSGEYVLVVIDEYSRFPEIDITTSTSAKATLPKLDRILSSFGIPISIKTNNGPPFTSKAFNDYCRLMGIKHQSITPRHPRANGLVENFNRMVKKVTRTAVIERKSWKQELYTFLRSYRATPHSTTGESPANLLF
ncbi:uncharacterized protein K02A2.6-like [Dendronephthya gigantea]|uniref:uncharacterized protein K02A2.6-like n=1 Tax=Dendronephthya gigantea TaxID=151771 RepID=UPI00106A76AF|nr:uncharacterized protein K02A2.6-like [Dendronephthya gigantea]